MVIVCPAGTPVLPLFLSRQVHFGGEDEVLLPPGMLLVFIGKRIEVVGSRDMKPGRRSVVEYYEARLPSSIPTYTDAPFRDGRSGKTRTFPPAPPVLPQPPTVPYPDTFNIGRRPSKPANWDEPGQPGAILTLYDSDGVELRTRTALPGNGEWQPTATDDSYWEFMEPWAD